MTGKYSLFQMWEPYRQSLIAGHQFYVNQARQRLLSQFDDIETEEPLFGDGLGLDSIDALELGLALKKKFDIKLDSNSEESKKHFYSVRTLADFIEQQKQGAA